MPISTKRARAHLERAGFSASHQTRALEIWSNGETELFVHGNGRCFLYPVGGSELNAREFSSRTIAYMIKRYAR